MGRIAVSLCAGLLAACLQPASQECANDLVCPAGTACDDIHGLCLVDEQRDVCAGVGDGQPCTFGTQGGICDRGVCLPVACGNNVQDAGEACEDGNTVSGDGCRADCLKIERCDDGVVDANEDCDDNNANPSDGCDACSFTRWRATALIGGTPNATAIGLDYPHQIAADRNGNLYIADSGANRIRRIDRNGVTTTIAGTGESGYSGDGGPATSARLNSPYALAVDGLGNVYFSDYFSRNLIRRIDPAGTITTIAGAVVAGMTGENIPALGADLTCSNLAVDGLGNIYFTDINRVRRISTTGMLTTVAGSTAATAGSSGDGGSATSALLSNPNGIALHDGNLYIADSQNQRIRRVDGAGIITTVAGTGTPGFSGDNGSATSAMLLGPTDVAFDEAGRMYIADGGNHRIRRVDASGTITTYAGSTLGFSGDGGAATAAKLYSPRSITVTGTTLFINDSNNVRVRRVDNAGVITTYAGTGVAGYTGEGHAATSPELGEVFGITRDAAGNVYLTDIGYDIVRKIDPTGVMTTVAGNGQGGFSGDGGPATQAQLNDPYDVAVDSLGNLYIADLQNNRVRRVDTTGTITTVAGNGSGGYGTDNVAATSTSIHAPFSITVDSTRNLYIADTYNHRVRKVTPAGTITTVAGTGATGYFGDGGPATSARLWSPQGLAVDAQDRLYIADTYNSCVRRIDANGVISTLAGTGSYGFSGDGGQATAAKLDTNAGIAIAANGDLIIADTSNQRIRRVDGAGIITTIAGTGGSNFNGDGGPATSALVQNPSDVVVDAAGRVLIADSTNRRVRAIDTSGRIVTIAGKAGPDEMGPLATARLTDPRAFVVASGFTLFAAGGSGTVQLTRSSPAWLETVAGRYPHAGVAGLARFQSGTFPSVEGIAFDEAASTLYFTAGNRIHVVTLVDAGNANTWTIATLANTTDTAGFADGAVAAARFRKPTGLLLDATAKQLYVADTGNHVIRAIDLTAGTVRTVAGVPATLGFAGDGGAADAALLYGPRALARCANGDLMIADTANHRIRRVAAGTNVITSVLGDGVAGSSGEGTPATSFPVHQPLGVACDAQGNVFVTSSTAVRVLAADAMGIVDGSGSVSTIYGAAPRDEFPASATRCLTGIAVIDAERVQVTDACTGILLELHREVMP